MEMRPQRKRESATMHSQSESDLEKDEPVRGEYPVDQSMAREDSTTLPSKKRVAAKMEFDDEESPSSWFGEAPPVKPATKPKRGPGRPRKPDSELRRPRRPRDGERRKRVKVEPRAEKEKKDVVVEDMAGTGRVGVVSRGRTKDQLISAQQQQIESMQEKLRQYEARIKAMEAGRFDSTPPTPAMSINHSSSLSHAHPQRNPPIPPDYSSHIIGANVLNDNTGGAGDREDSPLSVYSDLGLPELFESLRNTRGNQQPIVQDPIYRAKNGSPSLVVILKANPNTPNSTRNVSSPSIAQTKEERPTSTIKGAAEKNIAYFGWDHFGLSTAK